MTLTRLPPWLASRGASIVLLGLAVAFAATQFAGAFTESVNWDEFALFHRTERSATTGRLQGGGRPGLAVVAIAPFVRRCSDTMATVIQIRLLWVGVTLGMLTALFFLLRGAVQPLEERGQAAALGVAMIALVPVFMRWSIQVRTDQPAIAAALWASVALLASRRRPWLAAVAGALFVIGYLCSQKAIYVAALGGTIVLGDLWTDAPADRSRELRRSVWRVSWLAAGGSLVLLSWRATISLLYDTAPPVVALNVLNVFDDYREQFGYRVYRGMLPTLYPHVAGLVLLVLAWWVAYRRRTAHVRSLIVALAVAALGLAVGAFHAAAFPYFWMTLGLFPACAIALGWPGIAAAWPRIRKPLAIGLWACMLLVAIPYRLEVLEDTQAVQRDTFAFIERNFDTTTRGFHADGGLFCKGDPQPFPVYLREQVEREFGGPDGSRRADVFIAEFRTRQVAFIIDDFLLQPFPAKVREFWATHYVPYYGAASIAGRQLQGPAGTHLDVDIIIAGTYQWSGPGAISIDGTRVETSATIRLSPGVHSTTLVEDTPGGVLTLALQEPSRPGRTPFHAWAPIAEIVGERTEW